MRGLPATEFDSMEELIEKTRGPRARVIEALSFYDGRAHSQKIRNYGEIPSSTYHFNKLEEQGIIERDGTEYVSQGGSAIAYELTDFGWDVAEEIEGEPETGAELEELEDTMEALYRRLEQHGEGLDDQKADIEIMKDHFNRMAELVEPLIEDYNERHPENRLE
jgi:DNA-binding HxlR family transcriptional regulator